VQGPASEQERLSAEPGPAGPLLVLTVDTEPDWGVDGSEAVEEVLPRLLELLGRHRAGATFFVVAELLDRCEELLREVAGHHEIGSHGLTHTRPSRLSREEVRRELRLSRERLSERLEVRVDGVRAPFLEVCPGWFGLVAEAGFRYDSSIGRVYPSPRNAPAPRWRPGMREGIVEIPATAMRPALVPFSLTWLRLGWPLARALCPPAGGVFYLHPHELASPALLRKLPSLPGLLLRRRVGEAAWDILEGLLERWSGRTVSCRTLLQMHGYDVVEIRE